MLEAHHGQNSPAELPLRSLSSMTLMPLVSMAPRLAGACRGLCLRFGVGAHVLKPSSTSRTRSGPTLVALRSAIATTSAGSIPECLGTCWGPRSRSRSRARPAPRPTLAPRSPRTPSTCRPGPPRSAAATGLRPGLVVRSAEQRVDPSLESGSHASRWLAAAATTRRSGRRTAALQRLPDARLRWSGSAPPPARRRRAGCRWRWSARQAYAGRGGRPDRVRDRGWSVPLVEVRPPRKSSTRWSEPTDRTSPRCPSRPAPEPRQPVIGKRDRSRTPPPPAPTPTRAHDRVVAVARSARESPRRRARRRTRGVHVPLWHPGLPAPTALRSNRMVRFADDLVVPRRRTLAGRAQALGDHRPVRHARRLRPDRDEVAATFRMLAQAKAGSTRARARRLQRRLELGRRRRPAGLPRPPPRDPPVRPGTPRRPGHPRPPQGRRQPLVDRRRIGGRGSSRERSLAPTRPSITSVR